MSVKNLTMFREDIAIIINLGGRKKLSLLLMKMMKKSFVHPKFLKYILLVSILDNISIEVIYFQLKYQTLL